MIGTLTGTYQEKILYFAKKKEIIHIALVALKQMLILDTFILLLLPEKMSFYIHIYQNPCYLVISRDMKEYDFEIRLKLLQKN